MRLPPPNMLQNSQSMSVYVSHQNDKCVSKVCNVKAMAKHVSHPSRAYHQPPPLARHVFLIRNSPHIAPKTLHYHSHHQSNAHSLWVCDVGCVITPPPNNAPYTQPPHHPTIPHPFAYHEARALVCVEMQWMFCDTHCNHMQVHCRRFV